jgi:hypothetical protein
LVAFALFTFARGVPRRRAARARHSEGSTLVTASADEIVFDEAFVAVHVPWTSVTSLVESDKFLFLEHARGSAFMIPKRCFESAEAEMAFAEFVRRATRSHSRQDGAENC